MNEHRGFRPDPGIPESESGAEEAEGKEVFDLYSAELGVTEKDLAKTILDAGSANAEFETSAKKVKPEAKIVSIDFRFHPDISARADWQKLPFKSGTFDLALSRAALSIFEAESWIPAIRELIRVTRGGGEIRIARIFRNSERWKELEDYLEERERRKELTKELISIGRFPAEVDENTGEPLRSEEGYFLVVRKTETGREN